MTRDTDYIVDIQGLRSSDKPPHNVQVSNSFRGRPWLSVYWKCCFVYNRIYRNSEGTLYSGRCPRCGKSVQATIGSHGTSNRFFEAM